MARSPGGLTTSRLPSAGLKSPLPSAAPELSRREGFAQDKTTPQRRVGDTTLAGSREWPTRLQPLPVPLSFWSLLPADTGHSACPNPEQLRKPKLCAGNLTDLGSRAHRRVERDATVYRRPPGASQQATGGLRREPQTVLRLLYFRHHGSRPRKHCLPLRSTSSSTRWSLGRLATSISRSTLVSSTRLGVQGPLIN